MANNNNRRRQENNSSIWTAAAAVAGSAGLAALAGGFYWLTRKSGSGNPSSANLPNQTENPTQPNQNSRRQTERLLNNDCSPNSNKSSSASSYIINFLQHIDNIQRSPAVPLVSQNPIINNLNALLDDIITRYIALADEDRALYYKVFTNVFDKLNNAMKEVDPYYRKYSSMKQFAGSHYDRLRIKKVDTFPDEDIDIVIGLPLSFNQNLSNPEESDIMLESKYPGFVQLKMGVQFQRLLMRDGVEWLTNKTAYEWKDEKNYLLCSKFNFWFKSVVNKAINKLALNVEGRRFLYIEGLPYTIRLTEGGPAVTLIIENDFRGFKLDVDLVPALRFPEDRWPICRGYRGIPLGCSRDYWMVVPKPNKAAMAACDTSRSWRIALHDQERRLMHGTNNLRPAIRLMKKLRDVQGMDKIASYYIKTLFFWEIAERNDLSFWSRNNPAEIFKVMVKKLYESLLKGEIPYFWNKSNNLIGAVNPGVLNLYAARVKKVLEALNDTSNYKSVAKYLLTQSEYQSYKKILGVH